MADFGLRGYQTEVIERALQGENTIIWLPTGGGKTRAAVYVAKKHLETTPRAKVVVLVNKVHLVDQHYNNEFKPRLSGSYTVVPISGESEEKDFFGQVLQRSHMVICTAQILYNSMINMEENKHAELSDITLLIIDECHHTNKESVYNQIMACYVEEKLKGEKRLPQILGLTASPGTGGETLLYRAVDHVLQICANLDSVIVSTKNYKPELDKKVPRPIKRFAIVEKRPKDPFGDRLKRMMHLIHEFADIPPDFPLRQCGTQEYETDVVLLEKRGVEVNNRRLMQCASHLRKYNDSLFINDTLRMIDAYRYLKTFYASKTDTFDDTDIFLVGLFQKNQEELNTLANNPENENPRMSKLEETLLEQFGPNLESRGIIFCKTRQSTHCLSDWVLTNKALQEAGIKAAILTGAGNSISHMTLNEQADTIRSFRKGKLNLLISTSVAEEGLDIPECNLVVRYGLLTNDIAQQQATGRARERNSLYSVVAEENGPELRREKINEDLEKLTKQAVAHVQEMDIQEFHRKISELQKQAVHSREIQEREKKEKKNQNAADGVQLLCRGCLQPMASGSDIRVIDNTHYVNVSPDFKENYTVGVQKTIDKSFKDWEPGCEIRCKSCSQKWGFEMKYKKIAILPTIAIKNFALKTPEGQTTKKQWKDVTFPVEEFSFKEYCLSNHTDIFD